MYDHFLFHSTYFLLPFSFYSILLFFSKKPAVLNYRKFTCIYIFFLFQLSLFFVLTVIYFKTSIAHPLTREFENRPPIFSRLEFPFTRRFEDFLRNYYALERIRDLEQIPIDFYDRYYSDDIPLITDTIPIEHPVPLLPIGFGFPLDFNVSAIRGYLTKVLLPYFIRHDEKLDQVTSAAVEPTKVHAQVLSLSSVVSGTRPQIVQIEGQSISGVTPHVVDTKDSVDFPTDVPEVTHVVPIMETVVTEVKPQVEQIKEVVVPAVAPAVLPHTEEPTVLPAVTQVVSDIIPTVANTVTTEVKPLVDQTKEVVLPEVLPAVLPQTEQTKGVVLTSEVTENKSHDEEVKEASSHSSVSTDTKETKIVS